VRENYNLIEAANRVPKFQIPMYVISEMRPEVNSMNTTSSEQIAPEIVQAITAKAMARGMSVNDYLWQELGLTNGCQLSERPFYETATPEEWIIEFTTAADQSDREWGASNVFDR